MFDEVEKDLSSGLKSWTALLQNQAEDWVKFDDVEISKRTPAAMFFSSGTTGLPKAAILSHYNLVAQHTLVYETRPRSYQVRISN